MHEIKHIFYHSVVKILQIIRLYLQTYKAKRFVITVKVLTRAHSLFGLCCESIIN